MGRPHPHDIEAGNTRSPDNFVQFRQGVSGSHRGFKQLAHLTFIVAAVRADVITVHQPVRPAQVAQEKCPGRLADPSHFSDQLNWVGHVMQEAELHKTISNSPLSYPVFLTLPG